MENRNSKSAIIVLSVLLIGAVAAGGFFWKKNTDLDKTNQELVSDLETLNELRDDVIEDLKELEADYDEIMAVNDSMEVLYADAMKTVEERRAEINKIKSDFAKDAKGMKAEIDQLRTIKKELTVVIDQLKKENAALLSANEKLAGDVVAADQKNKELEGKIAEIKQLNLKMEKELSRLVAANSRVTNMRVDVLNPNDKITASHNRAKELVVSFELKNLPKDKLKEDRLYLVIKDAKGTPVKVKNPVSTTIKPNTGEASFPIIAQQTLRADLQNGSRLQFKQPLDEKLKRGGYRVAVYADWGLLGSASFQLK